MSKVVFPCCPDHPFISFAIHFNPVQVTAGIYMQTQDDNYVIEGMQPSAVISEATLRTGLFSTEKTALEKLGVKAICHRCNKEHNITALEIIHSCYECDGYKDLKFCKDKNSWYCKQCAGKLPKCGCRLDSGCFRANRK